MVRTKHPVPPASRVALSESLQLGPAMSRWTHGVDPTNCSRNLAAVPAPPPHSPPLLHRPPAFLLAPLVHLQPGRPPPPPPAGPPRGGDNLRENRPFVAKTPRHFRPQSDHARPGERRQVEHPLRLLLQG